MAQPTREHMEADVMEYMRYYNVHRLHSANDDLSPAAFEEKDKRPQKLCGGSALPEQGRHVVSVENKRGALAAKF